MITIYFDGLCHPKNPGGVAAYGYVIYRDNELIHQGLGIVGEGTGMTNNVAEYEGLRAAIRWVLAEGIVDKVLVKGDSQLVIKQMTGEWNINSATSKRYVPEINKLIEGMDVSFLWIPRSENGASDKLSRLAYEVYRTKRAS